MTRAKKPHNPFLPSILALLAAMTSIQFGASLAKQLFPIVGAAGATVLRLTFATLILFLLWRPFRHIRKTKLHFKDMLYIALYGASLGGMNLAFYMSLNRIPLGIAVAFEFTGPLAVALFSSRRPLDFLWAVLAIAGILLIAPPSEHLSKNLDLVGILFALGAGFFWALYILFGQKAGASIHGGTATTLGMLAATLVVLPFGIFSSGASLINLPIVPLAIGVALLSSAVPYSLEMVALKSLPTQTFGILMSLEPAIAAVSGLFFLGEHLSDLQWGGIFLIISASFGVAFFSTRTQNQKANDPLPNPVG